MYMYVYPWRWLNGRRRRSVCEACRVRYPDEDRPPCHPKAGQGDSWLKKESYYGNKRCRRREVIDGESESTGVEGVLNEKSEEGWC